MLILLGLVPNNSAKGHGYSILHFMECLQVRKQLTCTLTHTNMYILTHLGRGMVLIMHFV